MVVRTFPTVVRTAERPIGNSVRPFGSPVPKPRSGPPDLDRTEQYEWPQSTTLLASLAYINNVYSHGKIRTFLLTPPPSSRPLSPCPCNAAVPKGPAFSFLNYFISLVGRSRTFAFWWWRRTSLSYEIHNRVPRTSYEFEFATLVKTQTQIVTHTRDEIRDCRIETCHALAIRVILSGSLFNYILLN